MVSIAEARCHDARPPVLLLRSFDAEGIPLERTGNLLRGFFHESERSFTFEEFLTTQLSRLGPIIAVGKPGESERPIGAARDYVLGDDWKAFVTTLMGEARVIAVVLGEGDGLRWECKHLQVWLSEGRRTVIAIAPPVEPAAVVGLWTSFAEAFPAAVPLTTGVRASVLAARFTTGDAVALTVKSRDQTAYLGALECLTEPMSTLGQVSSGRP